MGAATHLVYSVQPVGYTSEGVLLTQPTVQALDAGNAVDTTFTGIVTLTPSLASAKFYTVTEPIATTHTVQAGTTATAVLVSPALSFPASLPSDYTGRGYWLRDDVGSTYSSLAPITSATGTGQVNVPVGTPLLPTGRQVSVHSGVLFPTIAMACVAGVAAFTAVRVAGFETVTLTASAPGLTGATSSAIAPTGTFDFASELPRASVDPTKPTITDATVFTINPANNDVSPNFKSFGSALTWFSANESTLNRQINVAGGAYNEVVTIPLRPPTAGALWFQWVTPLSAGSRAVPLLNMVGCPQVWTKDVAGGSLQCAAYAGGSNIARNVYFQNIDFTFHDPTNPALEINQIVLIWDGVGGTTTAGMPDQIGFTGCMARGTDASQLQRAVYYGGKRFYWVDGYIANAHGYTGDEQAILFAVAQGPALVKHTYVECGGEMFMLGGLDTTIADCVPSDIEILGNHFRRPLAWKGTHTNNGDGTWAIKNIIETKSCRRVRIEGNAFENTWSDGQNTAITLGSANQNGGSPWAGARDITFRFNAMRNIPRWLIASKFNNGAPTVGPAYSASKIAVHDNLIALNNSAPYNVANEFNAALFNGVDDFHYEHNTTLAEAGKALHIGSARGLRGSWSYNLMSFRSYGVTDDYSGNNYGAAFTYNFATSAKNVLLDLDTGFNAPFSSYDPTWGNSTIATVGLADPTKFANPATRLATFAQLIAAATLTPGLGGSIYNAAHNFTGDGKDAGADMTALAAALANSVVNGEGTNVASDTADLVGAADHLAISVQPSGAAISGVAMTTQPVVLVEDSSNATVTADSSTVTAAWVSLTGNATPSGTLTKVAVAGVAAFTTLALAWTVPSTGYWTFTDGALTSVNASTMTLTVAPPPPPPPPDPTAPAPAVYRMARGRAVFAGFRRMVRALLGWLTLSSSLAR